MISQQKLYKSEGHGIMYSLHWKTIVCEYTHICLHLYIFTHVHTHINAQPNTMIVCVLVRFFFFLPICHSPSHLKRENFNWENLSIKLTLRDKSVEHFLKKFFWDYYHFSLPFLLFRLAHIPVLALFKIYDIFFILPAYIYS